MKKERRLYFVAFLLIAALVAFPVARERIRQHKIDALLNRPPSADTQLLRSALKNCDEVRVYSGGEVYSPSQVFAKNDKPLFILRDAQARDMLHCLHVDPNFSYGKWTDFNVTHPPGTPIPGAAFFSTSLVFYRSGKMIADISVYSNQMRWYTPTAYKAEAPLLSASKDYIEDAFRQHGFKAFVPGGFI